MVDRGDWVSLWLNKLRRQRRLQCENDFWKPSFKYKSLACTSNKAVVVRIKEM